MRDFSFTIAFNILLVGALAIVGITEFKEHRNKNYLERTEENSHFVDTYGKVLEKPISPDGNWVTWQVVFGTSSDHFTLGGDGGRVDKEVYDQFTIGDDVKIVCEQHFIAKFKRASADDPWVHSENEMLERDLISVTKVSPSVTPIQLSVGDSNEANETNHPDTSEVDKKVIEPIAVEESPEAVESAEAVNTETEKPTPAETEGLNNWRLWSKLIPAESEKPTTTNDVESSHAALR